MPHRRHAASFRDPAGHVFVQDGTLKRVVTAHGERDYRQLIASGLYERLVRESLLVPHEEERGPRDTDVAAVLVPERIPYISYPYEWSFGQLRDAALLTLRIQQLAMEHGLGLKDASAFNVQFRGASPVFIDTLSFEANDGGPWVAYDQFCRHFVAPLLLMKHVAPDFNRFWKGALDGFSLELASTLLPRRTWLQPGPLLHVHVHARMQRRYAAADGRAPGAPGPAQAPGRKDRKPALVESLRGLVEGLEPARTETEWLRYYEEKSAHYSSAAEASKRRSVDALVRRLAPRLVYDLGGNVGAYARLATEAGAYTVCFDLDPLCVHANHARARRDDDRRMLPLLLDLTNPTPALGVGLRERDSVLDRGRADLAMALALVHHLRITGNVPLRQIAELLSRLGRVVLLEWVPKSDPMAQALLRSRKDTFHDYTDEGLSSALDPFFTIEETVAVADTQRVLLVCRSRA